MHFGTFMEFGTRAEGSHAEAFREGFTHAMTAEAEGLDSVWLAEFHFMPDRSVLSSPIVVAGALATATKRVRIGMAVYVLPLANPLRVAEEAATVDQISGGRLDFGIGRSGFARQYNGYAIDYGESQARFAEAMHVIREAWKGERFTFDGEFYHAHDALVVPRPVQRPHPPMRMAASSTPTFPKVAEQGLPLFVGLRGDGLDLLRANIDSYRRAWKESGQARPASVFLRVPVYAAASEKAAHDEPRECITHYFARQARLVANAGTQGPDAGRGGISQALAGLGYDDILASRVAFGTPRMLVERLTEWRDALGLDGIVMELNAGNMLSEAQVLNSLRLVAREVMPAFR